MIKQSAIQALIDGMARQFAVSVLITVTVKVLLAFGNDLECTSSHLAQGACNTSVQDGLAV